MSTPMPAASARTALLVGATGLAGGHCLNYLLNDDTYGRVVVLVRRPLEREHPQLEQHLIDFDQLQETSGVLRAHDIYCCLGTTIRKAGSREAFRRVDYEYPVQIARTALENGAEQLLIVTSLGADPRSRIFYNRVKGEVEEAVKQLPFRRVVILRPSLLLGERVELRRGERLARPIARALSPLLLGPLRRYRPIEARTVAAAMVGLAREGGSGIAVVESDRIAAYGAR